MRGVEWFRWREWNEIVGQVECAEWFGRVDWRGRINELWVKVIKLSESSAGELKELRELSMGEFKELFELIELSSGLSDLNDSSPKIKTLHSPNLLKRNV